MLRNSYKSFFDYNTLILRYCSFYLKDEEVTTAQTVARKIHSFVFATYAIVIFFSTEATELLLNTDNMGNFIQILRDTLNHFGGFYKTYVWYKHQEHMSSALKILTNNYNYETHNEFQPEMVLTNNKNLTLKLYKSGLLMVNLLCVFMALADVYLIFNPDGQVKGIRKFPNFGNSLSGQLVYFLYRMTGLCAFGWILVCKQSFS